MPRSRRGPWIVALATALVAAFIVVRSPAWTVDDAYIVARYAQNLVHHGTLSWNTSGPRVEGITGSLLVLFESLVVLFGGSGVIAAKWLSGLGFVAGAVLVVAIAYELRDRTWFMAGAALLFVIAGEHAPHLRSGLETEFYGAANLAGVLCVLRDRRTRACSVPLLVTCNVLVLTRPEGALVAMALLAASLWTHEAERATAARRAVFGFLAPTLVVTLARWGYFGSLLPNTFYAKQGASNTEFIHDLWCMTSDSCLDVLLLGVLAMLVARARGSRMTIERTERALVAVACVVIVVSAVVYGRSELVMNYGRRFAVHVFPWVLVATLIAATALVDFIGELRHGRLRVAVVALGLVSLGNAIGVSFAARREASVTAILRGTLTLKMYDGAEEWIAANAPNGATLACYPDAGKIPYVTGLRALDFGKLNDAYLARTAKTPTDVADYFYGENPELLLLWKREGGAAYDEGAAAIVADTRFVRYRIGFAHEQADGSGLFVYVRDDARRTK